MSKFIHVRTECETLYYVICYLKYILRQSLRIENMCNLENLIMVHKIVKHLRSLWRMNE